MSNQWSLKATQDLFNQNLNRKQLEKFLLDEIKREKAAGDFGNDEQVLIQDIAAHI